MSEETRQAGGDLFIVDNSDADWKVRQYLHEWAAIAASIDIATGYFEIGALLALDGQWQKLDALRVLMGDEVSKRTKKALVDGVDSALLTLDRSIEEEKKSNDFLSGIDAIVDGLRQGKISGRIYAREKFHAKAYINHARSAVVGSAALVGSSNFTFPGLTQNVELNIQVRGREVELLQQWYERHWDQAEDITGELLRVIERHAREYSPFEVYAKALHEYFRSGDSLTPDEWEATQSRMFKALDQYQRDGYKNLLKIANVYNGALLCDGVGLGKTFIGLMLIERFAIHEKRNVLLIVPKSGRDTVWGPEIQRHLPELEPRELYRGRLAMLTHTDLTATSEQAERRLAEAKADADIVIIDEAHNFRNIGTRGSFTGDLNADAPARGGKLVTGEGKVAVSRYRRLFDLVGDKPLYLLTATPVNNDLSDLRHLIELFSRRNDKYFADRPVAINNLRAYFNELKKRLTRATGPAAIGLTDSEEAKAVLGGDPLVSALVVQRSRGFVKEHQRLHGGRTVTFPERDPPQVAAYSLRGVYGNLLDLVEEAFHKKKPLFSLPMYQPMNYPRQKPTDEDQETSFAKNRQTQVVALIRTAFLKRLESSIFAFQQSCQRLLIKLLAFIVRNAETEKERARFEKWKRTHKNLVAELQHDHPELFTIAREPTLLDDLEDDRDDLLDDDLLESIEKLSRDEFKVGDMIDETMGDLDVVAQLLNELRGFKSSQDVKLKALIKLLKSDPALKNQKVIIFSEFADTAEYLRENLIAAGIGNVEAVDGSAAARDRLDVIRRFAPYYNRSDSAAAEAAGGEIRVLVSTDVLSEGLNLQDATRLVNYDLHWNPVRLMQRIGRVDRRMNPEIEARLIEDHPDLAPLRGRVCYWNFLPPEELNRLLSLYTRVTEKTLNISKTFGIEGRKLLRPEDDFDALRDFNASYERQTKVEQLAIEYEQLLKDHPGLAERLDALPGRVFSGKAHPAPGTQAVFFCFQLPTRVAREPWGGPPDAPLFDPPIDGWAISQGPVRWYIYDIAKSRVLEPDAPSAADLIRSTPETPRQASIPRPTLSKIRAAVEKHIKDSYLKQTQAPLTAPKPVLKCWMELS